MNKNKHQKNPTVNSQQGTITLRNMYHLKAYCFSARQSICCIFQSTLQPSVSSMNTQGTSNSSNSYSKQPKQFSMAKHSVFHSPGSRQEAATAQYSHQ